MKSPAWELAVRPLQARQDAAFQEYANERDEYERERAVYEADLQAWKRDGRKKGQPPPDRPDEPAAVRYLAADATVEALAVLLEQNPRGLLLARDELSGWLSSFDAYKAARGADVAHWLSMHRAGPLTVDRKSGRRLVHVPRASVSIAGSTQPEILAMALGGRYDGERGSREHFANGLAARLLMAHPPRLPKRWTDADLSGQVVGAVDDVLSRLLELDAQEDENGQLQPVSLPLTPEAQGGFVRFYNAHADEQATLGGDLAAAWSKLEGYAARFALLVHLVRDAADDPTLCNRQAVDLRSIEAGISLSRWFADEAARIYAEIGGTPDSEQARKERERGRLVEWIGGKGGEVTARDLSRGPRQYRGDSKAAEASLQDLVDAGLGSFDESQPSERGGRPTQVFRLAAGGDESPSFLRADSGDGDETPGNPEKCEVLSPSPPSPLPENEVLSPGERVRVTI